MSTRKLQRQIARAMPPEALTPEVELEKIDANGFRCIIQIELWQQRLRQLNARRAALVGQPGLQELPVPPPPPPAPEPEA